MKILEPLECIIYKNKPFALFRIQNNDYLLFNGVQTCMAYDFDENDVIILKGEDVIPFVLVHNMRIDTTINVLRNNNHGGNHHLLNVVKNAHIENELNTNLTVDDIYREYDDGIITYDELYLWLIIYAQNKYRRE